MIWQRLLVTLAASLFQIVLTVAAAYGLSCSALADRYVVACHGNDCIPRFRVREVPAFGGTCARRIVFAEFPVSDMSRVGKALQEKLGQLPNSLVEVNFRRSYIFLPEYDVPLQERLDILLEKHPYQVVGARIIAEEEAVFRAALEKRSADELRQEQIVQKQFWIEFGLAIFPVSAGFVGFGIWFVKKLRRGVRPPSWRLLGLALGIDLVIFVAGVAGIGWTPMYGRSFMGDVSGFAVILGVVMPFVLFAIFAVARLRGWGAAAETTVPTA